jgi:hypothetical protein
MGRYASKDDSRGGLRMHKVLVCIVVSLGLCTSTALGSDLDSLCVAGSYIKVGMKREEVKKRLGSNFELHAITDSTDCFIWSRTPRFGYGRVGFDRNDRVDYAAKDWYSGGSANELEELYKALQNMQNQGYAFANISVAESYEPKSAQKEIVVDYGRKKLRILFIEVEGYKQVSIQEILNR